MARYDAVAMIGGKEVYLGDVEADTRAKARAIVLRRNMGRASLQTRDARAEIHRTLRLERVGDD